MGRHHSAGRAVRGMAAGLVAIIFLFAAISVRAEPVAQRNPVVESPEPAPGVIELDRSIPVYSLKPPYGQVGELRPGAKVTVLENESPSMIRVRFRKGPGVLAEAQCRAKDILPGTEVVAQASPGSWIRPRRVTVAYSPDGEARPLILREVRNARSSIDVAMFYLSDDDLVDALCYKAQRKIPVRVLTGSSMAVPAHEPMLKRLAQHGVSVYVLRMPNSGRMHLKRAVIDGETVIAGTANWTPTAFEENFEDTVIVESRELAERYREKLETLFANAEPLDSGEYADSKDDLKFPEIEKYQRSKTADRFQANRSKTFTGISRMEIYFCPGRDGMHKLLSQIRQARERVDIGMYLLTDPKVVETLVEVAARGQVKMRVLLDSKMLETGLLDEVQRLWDAGIKVYYFRGDRKSLHLKTAVIDGRTVWTGTANWTTGAMELNVEDMLVFESPDMARLYTEFLDGIQEHCESFAPLAVDHQVAKVEEDPGEYDQAGYLIGLPPTGPRTEFTGVDRAKPFPAFEVEEATVSYVPDEKYVPVLLDLIRNADQSILVAMFVMSETKTDAEHQERVVRELERAAQRGVYVYLLLHTPTSAGNSLHVQHSNWAERLRAQGVDVRLNTPGVHLHAKMVVVDLAKVLIGSHNWSEGALSGNRVYESSALLVLPQQDLRLAEYILSRQTITDMRSRELWEGEIATLRHLRSLGLKDRKVLIQKLEAQAQP